MSIGAAKRWSRVAGTGRAGEGGTLGQRLWKARWCYLFAAPSLLLATAFSFYPTVASWYFSLLDWSGLTSSFTFIGLANYQEVIHDSYFWQAFLRSFLFMFAAVPIKFVLTLIVAIILNDKLLRLSPLFRTLFFLPVVTTAAIDGIVMTFLFSPVNGPINRALIDVHILPKRWTSWEIRTPPSGRSWRSSSGSPSASR
ncbi:MAG TPA: sugar ABC transporter permease [Chloroflexota bacterium]